MSFDGLRGNAQYDQLTLELGLAIERWKHCFESLTGVQLVDAQLLAALTDAMRSLDAKRADAAGVTDLALERARKRGLGAASLEALSRQRAEQSHRGKMSSEGSVTANEPWDGCVDQIAAALAAEVGTPVLRGEVSRMALERGLAALVAELGLEAPKDDPA